LVLIASSGAGENYIALLEKISSKLIESISGTGNEGLSPE
jgi:hypothetical protein